MSSNLLKLVNEIIRESEINLDGEKNEINELTKQISEKIKGHVPNSLKVLTFATIRLRDIGDHTNWAKNMFPNAEPYYFANDESIKNHYEEHINKLKTELPNVRFKRKSSTVVGALCEGLVGISMLEVRVHESSITVIVDEQNARILITPDVLKDNYDDTHDALQKYWLDDPKHVDFAVYVTMLSKLLVKWDVVVITANNIKREGADNKSGLAGAIFCFERGSDHDDFIVNLPAFFAPILQLVANAALLESTHHHHGHNKKNIDALKKLRPFIDTIKMMEHDILKAVGGCFGDDLARFYADLCFSGGEGPDSLRALFGVAAMTTERRGQIGNSGIFHLTFKEYSDKQDALNVWLIKKFPEIYPHLEANEDFKQLFISKFSEVKNMDTWRKLFPEQSTNSPLRKLLYSVENRCIFLFHVEAMKSALEKDFSGACTIKKPSKNKAYVTLTLEDASENVQTVRVSKENALEYLTLVSASTEIPLMANFARCQFHPYLWHKLYGGKVAIEWKNVKKEVIASVEIDIKNIAKLSSLEWSEGQVATSFVAKYEI